MFLVLGFFLIVGGFAGLIIFYNSYDLRAKWVRYLGCRPLDTTLPYFILVCIFLGMVVNGFCSVIYFFESLRG